MRSIAYAIENRDDLEEFADEQPSTVKWSCMERGKVNHYSNHDVLVPVEGEWSVRSNRQVWRLADWVEQLLDSVETEPTERQLTFLSKYGDTLVECQDEFIGRETDLAGRTLGALHEHDLLEMSEDNRHKQTATVWETTDFIKEVRQFYDQYE